MRAVPEGWAWTVLGEICTKPQYGWTTKASHREGSIKLVRTTDITKGRIDWKTVPFCTEGPVDEEKYLLRSGDIVISRAGSVGASMLLQDPIPRAVFASYLIRFKTRLGVDPRFVGFFLKTTRYWAAIRGSASGIALPNVNAKKLAALDLPLAPLAEQRCIVGKIESLFAKLDKGVAALKRAEANLERYRASVLKAAVEGRLTEHWRSENPPEETGEQLLQRILAERRKRWEAGQLAKFEAKGRKPPRNWRAKYKEPVAPDTSGVPELPDGWCWATVDQVSAVTGGLTKNPARSRLPIRYPYLRVANVYADELRLDDVRTIGVSESELDRVLLRSGDLLVVEGNGSAGQIGRVAQWQGDLEPCCHQNHLIKVRCASSACRSRWMLLWLLSPLGRRTVLAVASSTSGLHTLSLSKVRALPVPLAPMREQGRAVYLAASLSDAARVAQEQIEAETLVRAAALRQSILKRAFEGRLVPQDPADESASVLLERIRAEREAERKCSQRRAPKPRRQHKSRFP